MMRICVLAPEFLPVWGGVGTYTVELVRHLPKKIEVHVVTPRRVGIGKCKISTSDYDFSQYFGDNVKIHFASKANDTFFYNGAFQYFCMRHVPNLVKEEGIDLVHSHTAHMPDLLLQYRRLNIPTLTTIHTTIRGQRAGTIRSGMRFWDLESSEKLTYLMYPFLRLAETLYFLKDRYYITVSDWMKNQMIKQYPRIGDQIKVVYNAVDSEQFCPGKGTLQRDMILFTGRLIAAKGIRFLIDAIPVVLREHPQCLFLFIGAGDYLPYERRLKEMNVPAQNYAFLGYLKDASQLIEYYRAQSVYVAPTLYENLPIRVLEAMACGIPVVASNVCAVPEIIQDGVNGYLIYPGSVRELADRISSLLANPSMRRRMGLSARKTVTERFNWNANAIKISDLYHQILNNS
jgi:glycosyltransferase involved in cell wall biosynthesis